MKESIFSSPVGSLCMPYPWRCPASVGRRTSCVICIHHNYQKDIKSIFSANVHHVPGLCLQGIGGAPLHGATI